jgi:hypothetical protein
MLRAVLIQIVLTRNIGSKEWKGGMANTRDKEKGWERNREKKQGRR